MAWPYGFAERVQINGRVDDVKAWPRSIFAPERILIGGVAVGQQSVLSQATIATWDTSLDAVCHPAAGHPSLNALWKSWLWKA